MLKSEIDLKELQGRYKSALQQQKQQHKLLCELKGKLEQASKFYRESNLQNLVLDDDTLEQDKSEAVESDRDDNTPD